MKTKTRFHKLTAWLLTLAMLITFIPSFSLTASAFDGEFVPITPARKITVNTTENGSIVADKTTAKEGDTVTLTVTPAEGYELDTLAVKDADNNDVAVTDNTFTMPAKAVTVTATFKRVYKIIIADNIQNGTLTADKYVAAEGELVTLTATPNEGYEKGQYSTTVTGYVSISLSGNVMTMPACDVTVSVNFVDASAYKVTLPANAGCRVQMTEDTVYPVPAGGSYSFTVIISDNYEKSSNFAVLEWGDQTELYPDEDGIYTIENINKDLEIYVRGVKPKKPDSADDFSGSKYIPFKFVCDEDETHTISATYFDANYATCSDVYYNNNTGRWMTDITFNIKEYFEDNVDGHTAVDLPETAVFSALLVNPYWQYGTSLTTAYEVMEYSMTCALTTYTVKVADTTNGTVEADLSEAIEGDTVTLTVTPAEGYELDTLTAKDADDNDVTVSNNTFTMPAGNVTVSATFKAKTYKITYVLDGGTINGEYTTSYTFGQSVSLPQDVTRDGYHFAGWYDAAEGGNGAITGFGRPETGDKTFYARWTPKTYTVTWMDEDGYTMLEKDTNVPYGTTPSYDGKTPTKAENAQYTYKFAGWTPEVSTVTGNATYKATFTQTAKTYTITYVLNGGKINGAYASSYTFGQSVSLPQDVTRDGYHFAGWYDAAEGGNGAITGFGSTETGDKTFYARWTPKTYTVKFVDHDGKEIGAYQTIEHGKAATAPADPTRTGYTFTGWDKAFNNVTSNLTVTAQYTINTYTVTFNDHDGSEIDSQTVNHGSAATAPENPVREGYNFTGWDKTFDNVTSNLTVTALYEEKATVSITQTAQTYTYGGTEKAFAISGTSLTGFTVEYYVEDAWTTDAPTDAGKYDVRITRDEDGTYKAFEKEITDGLVINPMPVSGATVGTFAAMTYDGTEQIPAATVTIDGLTVTGTWSKVTNVADKTTFTADGNFTGTIADKETGMLKANSSVSTVPGANTLTYSEAAQELVTAGAANGGTIKYSLDNATWNDAIPTATNADTYEVWYKVFGDANHKDTDAVKVDVTIAKKSIEAATVALDGALTYTGAEQTQNVTVTLDGFTVTFDVTDNKATSVKTDGNYTLKVTANGNFEGEKTLEWNIAKATPVPNAEKVTTARVRRGQKLANATVTNGEFFAVDGTTVLEGTFAWVDDTKEITTDSTEKMKFTPVDTNYAEIEIDVAVDSYTIGGGGSSSSSTSTTTTKNDDGSTTKTTTNKVTGTTTEVTTNTDGSTTTVETKKDGTVTTTEKDKDGNTTTTVENPDGSSTTTEKNKDGSETVVEKDTDGTTTTTEKDSEGNKTVTTEKADGSTTTEETKKDGTKVTTETNADSETTAEVEAKGETEVVIPVDNADEVTKVVVTDKDGNETEVEFEVKDGGIAISVSGNSTVSVQTGHTCYAKDFTDVDLNAWYHLNIDYVLENGLFKGTTETTFAPNDNLTRAMLVTVLYRAEGAPATNRSIPFADVDMGSYYANAVIWAQQNGIVKGVSETEFAPNDNITREQIAAILYRYAIYKGMDAVNLSENLSFTDADEISEYAISALNWAVGTGLIKGYEDNTVRPLNNATRAEAAALLQRFIEANK